MRRLTRFELGLVGTLTMTVATFPLVVFGVLAADLIAEFDADRWQIGILVTAAAITGGLLSPAFGRITDHWGGVRASGAALGIGLFTFSGIALAPTYLLLVAAALFSGIPQGWGNPASNALIIENVDAGRRGVITGIKQSGVQVGTFLGGALLPLFAGLWGWRPAVLVFLVIPLVGLGSLWGRSSANPSPPPSNRAERPPVPAAVKWIAAYGAVTGLATSAAFTFLPLFVQEAQGWSVGAAGWLLAGIGLVGVASRIAWGPIAERRLGHGRVLWILSIESTIAALVLAWAASSPVSPWLLIFAALLFGIGAVAWNSVGMLAVMDLSPEGGVGRGTGVVLLGFLLGFGLGAPLMGLSVDALGTYSPGWLVVAVLFASGSIMARRVRAASTLAVP